MNFELHWIDVSDNLQKREQPVVLFQRPTSGNRGKPDFFSPGVALGRVGDFFVPSSDLLQQEIKWAVTSSGDAVRVPVFAYNTSLPGKSSILATGFELGFRAARTLPIDSRRVISDVKLFMHRDVARLADCYCCYIGIAVRCDNKG